MYIATEKDADGWVVRLFDQNGNRASPIVYRVSYELAANEMIGELPVDIVADLMHEMRRQVMEHEAVFHTQPTRCGIRCNADTVSSARRTAIR
jgi:hypothetical protein